MPRKKFELRFSGTAGSDYALKPRHRESLRIEDMEIPPNRACCLAWNVARNSKVTRKSFVNNQEGTLIAAGINPGDSRRTTRFCTGFTPATKGCSCRVREV